MGATRQNFQALHSTTPSQHTPSPSSHPPHPSISLRPSVVGYILGWGRMAMVPRAFLHPGTLILLSAMSRQDHSFGYLPKQVSHDLYTIARGGPDVDANERNGITKFAHKE